MSTITQPAFTGSCQCGAVTYTSTEIPTELTNCHCTICRKLSGGPYMTFGGFSRSSFKFTSPPDAVKTTQYSKIATRMHCEKCGTPVGMQYFAQPQRIGITAGTFDEVRGTLPRVTEHIFLAEKAAWFEVPEDGLPRFDGFPEEFARKLEMGKTNSGE